MPLVVNLRHLEAHELRLAGELPAKELDIDPQDEVIRAPHPLRHDLEVQILDGGLLIQGRLGLTLECECVRCLKPFQFELELSNWTCHLPFQGDEPLKVVNDCVDLTPYIREDILLEFPRHPLCSQECRGLPKPSVGKAQGANSGSPGGAGSSAWAELNKLKF